jgi:polysaccharide pyruvyl transferase WcaK-like protein
MKRNRVLLLGAYGQTNLGDDVLLYNYLKFLTEKGFKEIYINTARADLLPKSVMSKFDNVKVFETYNTSTLKLLSLLRQSDCVVYGGGTVYKELYSSTGRSKYAVILNVMGFNLIARLLGKRVYGFHIGIGTIKSAFGRLITKLALNFSEETSFRDEKSYLYAKDVLRVNNRKITLSTDGMFINSEWESVWDTLEIPKHSGRTVGVNLLSDIPDWVDRKAYINSMVQFLDKLMADGDFVVFMPFQTDFDGHDDLTMINKEVLPKLKGKNYYVAQDLALQNIISCLKQLDMLVGMRFHSLLLATMARTPFVGLAYDTKCWRFMDEIGYPHALKIEDLTADALYEKYQQALKAPSVADKLDEARDKNVKVAKQWLQSTSL